MLRLAGTPLPHQCQSARNARIGKGKLLLRWLLHKALRFYPASPLLSSGSEASGHPRPGLLQRLHCRPLVLEGRIRGLQLRRLARVDHRLGRLVLAQQRRAQVLMRQRQAGMSRRISRYCAMLSSVFPSISNTFARLPCPSTLAGIDPHILRVLLGRFFQPVLVHQHVSQIVMRHPAIRIMRQRIPPERFQVLINRALLPGRAPQAKPASPRTPPGKPSAREGPRDRRPRQRQRPHAGQKLKVIPHKGIAEEVDVEEIEHREDRDQEISRREKTGRPFPSRQSSTSPHPGRQQRQPIRHMRRPHLPARVNENERMRPRQLAEVKPDVLARDRPAAPGASGPRPAPSPPRRISAPRSSRRWPAPRCQRTARAKAHSATASGPPATTSTAPAPPAASPWKTCSGSPARAQTSASAIAGGLALPPLPASAEKRGSPAGKKRPIACSSIP